jgi:hypothetical protein
MAFRPAEHLVAANALDAAAHWSSHSQSQSPAPSSLLTVAYQSGDIAQFPIGLSSDSRGGRRMG